MASRIISTVATLHGEPLFRQEGASRCQLVVIEGADMGRAVGLRPDEPLIVGSDSGCGLVLGDERVSRRHLSVLSQQGGFVVRDLESRNGTLYAGSTITEATVPVGATLKLGHTFLRIQPVHEVVEIDPSQQRCFGEMVAESLAMREIFAVLELAAQSEVTVLIEGETGTGKELAARGVHDLSERRRGPFVAVDCGALPENLVESELFGHVKGAFTGAAADRKGAFLRAHGGTLFLDELDSVPMEVQAKLLRVIEERKVKPVGADLEHDLDVRIIAASRANLPTKVAEGTFRPDLFYRLSVMRVELPPLRRRREDIAPIVTELLRRRGFEGGAPAGPNLGRLFAHDWQGNVRELRNVLDRAIALAPGASAFEELRVAPQGPVPGQKPTGEEPIGVRSDLSFAEAKQAVLQTFEARYLQDVLERCQGNISAAAREANLDRKHLKTLLRKHGLL